MKKVLLLFVGLMVSMLTFADSPNVVVIDDLAAYHGSEPFVYNKKDGKVYAYNSLNEYEQYGLYTKVNSLKVASGNDTAIEYIEAVSGVSVFPYINTGYTHTPETRVVVECTLSDSPEDGAYNWQAVFGARAGITSQAFMFFNRQGGNDRGGYVVGTVEQWGEDGNNIPHGQRIVIDCQGQDAKVYYASNYPNGEPVIQIHNSSTPTNGNCPLLIFTNNNNGGRQGADTHHGSSSALMKLHSFKIFEGENTEPELNLQPYMFLTGQAGLKDVATQKRYYAEEGEFVYPEGIEVGEGGIGVYVGKRVNYLVDNHEYIWDGQKWVDLGEMSTKPFEIADDYKNMLNWTCPDSKYECFGIPTADNPTWTYTDANGEQKDKTATYDEETTLNTFPHYIGTGMHEPIGFYIPVVEGNSYRYSFDFGSAGWDCSWNGNNPTMHAGVISTADLKNTNFTETCTSLGGSNGVLGFYKLPTDPTYDDDNNIAPTEHVVIDFMATQDGAYLFFPFGYVSDGQDYKFLFQNMTLEEFVYPDLYNEVNIYRPQLEVLIGDAEDFAGGTTDALQAALEEALNKAKEAYNDVENRDAQKDAIKYLTEALNAAKAVNISALRKTVAICEEEGITKYIDEAKAFFVDGTDVSVANSLLNNLRNFRKKTHSEYYAPIFKGTEPEEGDFYLYNVGQKLFFTGGDDWGTHAAVGFPGTRVSLIAAEDGNGYIIETFLSNGENSDFLNYGGYVDTSGQDPWAFVEVGEGKYNIVRANEPENMLGYSEGTFARVDTDKKDGADANSQWILVTEEEREALLEEASDENPVDATWLIVSPGFNQREDVSQWVLRDGGPNTGIWGRGSNYPDFVYECWNGGNNNDKMDLSQTVAVPFDGYYILTVQGYYRDGNIDNQVQVLEEGGEPISEAYLYAIDDEDYKEVALPNIFEGANKAPAYGYETSQGEVPNSCYQATNYFQNGLYRTSLVLNVAGTVDFGIYKETTTLEDWTVFDNFRLVYVGTEEPTSGIKNVDVEANNVKNGKVYNLQGVEVKGATQRGVYIKNGRKFVK
ncbi:MAG: hypothetical protein IJ196_06565 [Prevotella sp.]|nr:hypothetical protein [Prevotella sp.]